MNTNRLPAWTKLLDSAIVGTAEQALEFIGSARIVDDWRGRALPWNEDLPRLHGLIAVWNQPQELRHDRSIP